MTLQESPYHVLGVKEVEQDGQITASFRERILEFKRDRLKPSGQQRINVDRFRLICRAYETLTSPKKRAYYLQTKQWTSYIPVEQYTLQQLVAEPNLFPELQRRLHNATLNDINAPHPETGQTPLYCAARVGNAVAVRYLTENGADPDVKQRSKSTALHVAAYYGHPDVVQCLLECGADYSLRNAYGNQAEDESFNDEVKNIFAGLKQNAYVQAAANDIEWFKKYQKQLPHPDFQYHTLVQTLLHCASKKGHKDLVKWLVEEHGASLDIIDVNMNSALHLAAFANSPSIVKYLLNKGADPLLVNKWGMTAEQEGAIHGEAIKSLFRSMKELDAFTMAKDGEDWWFQYYFGDRSPNMRNNDGAPLLYVAARYGQTAVVKWLLDHGASIDKRLNEKPKSTPIHAAAYHNHKSTVELLLSYGADVTIRNEYGSTVFEDAKTPEIKALLNEHRMNLEEGRLISVHLFADGAKGGNEALAKLKVRCDCTFAELLELMPEKLQQNYSHFSMARRPLNAKDNTMQVVSTVCRARYGKTKFIELPLCITAHETARYIRCGHVLGPELECYSLREFHKNFDSKCTSAKFKIIATKGETQFKENNLLFTFPAGCTTKDLSIYVNYIFSPDCNTFGLEQCVCIFNTRCSGHNKLVKMPTVSLIDQPDAIMYTWTQYSAYWFTSGTRDKSLPLMGGVHAFVRHIDIIPSLLSLPADMFIQNALGKPLTERKTPIPCLCLKVRERDASVFPHIAYHGTKLQLVKSILMDGFVMPSTVVSSGLRVCPPSCHIARGKAAFGIEDFANGIFLSPSVYYCSDPCYAVTFTHNDERLLPVLECAVKDGYFTVHKCTVKSYTAQENEDLSKMEWRFTNPAAIEILSVLFIPVMESRKDAAKTRAKKLGVDPNKID